MPASLQLVVPCYNEAGRLTPEAYLERVGHAGDVDFLFVDDGSRDATPAILADMARRGGGHIAVLTLSQNVGKAAAVQRGVLAAFERQPDFVGFWDADLAAPLTAIPAFMEVFKARPEIEIVMGARVKLLGRDIKRSLIRHYCGRIFATTASFALGIEVYDTQCGAKIFRATDPVRRIFSAPFRSKWIFDVEILSRYIAATGSARSESQICELPLQTWTAMPGSKLTAWHVVRAVWDLARMFRR
jgi:glycosyltransferase involved in cell wall biosynthesis